jgi:hypothetical protein
MRNDLAALIDKVMLSGDFISLKLFVRKDGTSFVSLERSYTNAHVCDQVIDPAAPPSEHILVMLQSVGKPAKTVDQFEDLLG